MVDAVVAHDTPQFASQLWTFLNPRGHRCLPFMKMGFLRVFQLQLLSDPLQPVWLKLVGDLCKGRLWSETPAFVWSDGGLFKRAGQKGLLARTTVFLSVFGGETSRGFL